jgi:HEAT repeat protein
VLVAAAACWWSVASAGLAERYRRPPRVQPRVETLLEKLGGGQEAQREAARAELVTMGRRSLPHLLDGLADREERVRYEVVSVLAALDDPRVPAALCAITLDDPGVTVRWHAALGLASGGHEEAALPPLLAGLRSADDGRRWNAALALSALGRLEAVAVLHEGVGSPDPWRRWEAVNALRRVNDQDTARVLAPAVLNGPSPRLRGEAVLALSEIGGEQALLLISRALEDPEASVRWRACAALGKLRDERGLPPLVALHGGERDSRVRQEAERAMARITGVADARSARAPGGDP